MPISIPEEYISTHTYQGLTGRRVDLPNEGQNQRHWLLIPGHHSSQERMYSIAQFFQRYGRVTVVDLPGFGGMPGFRHADMPTNFSSYGRYLSDFVKKNPATTDTYSSFAISFGFGCLTTMLQDEPELQDSFDIHISFGGFGAATNLRSSVKKRRRLQRAFKIAGTAPFGFVANQLVLQRTHFFRWLLPRIYKNSPKFLPATEEEKQLYYKVEEHLWQCNDWRTQALTAEEMHRFDLASDAADPIETPLYNVYTDVDQYLIESSVNKTLAQLYTPYRPIKTTTLANHSPSILADADAVAEIFPDSLHAVFKK